MTAVKKKKKVLAGLAAVLALVVILSGTFAWIQAKDSVLNELSTNQITDGSVVIQEVFTPPDSWNPGMTVDKQVNLINTGEGTVLIRVSFEEILTLLNANGAVAKTDTPVLTAAQADWIPVKVNTTNYLNDAGVAINGWTKLAAATQIDTSSLDSTNKAAIDAAITSGDITILMKQEGNSFGYFAYRTDGTTKQRMDLGKVETALKSDGTFDKVVLLGVDPGTDENVKFDWYQGQTTTKLTWAGTNEFVNDSSMTAAKPAFSITASTLNIMRSPLDVMAKNANSRIQILYGTYNDGTEKIAVTDSMTDVSTAAAAGEALWYYNDADGYFYYMGKVEPGMATKQLLSALKMDEAAGAEYSLTDYKLGVISDAIQNTEEAILAASGWGLTSQASTNAAFVNFLKGLCDD